MSFNPVFIGDITSFPCDVIINSLGVNTTDYGGICKSIVKASNNKIELEDIIKRANDIYDVGEYFFTEGYGLPVKSICHLITPHRDSDNENFNVFIYAVRNVLKSCMGLGYKSIGVPLLGTGANKYNHKEIYELLCDICGSFCEHFSQMSVTIVLPSEEIADDNNARLIRELRARGPDFHDSETMKKFKKSTKMFKDYYEYSEGKITFSKSFFLKKPTVFDSKSKMNLEGVDKISTYINEFIDAKFIGNGHKKAKKNVYAYLGYGKKDPISAGTNTFNKMKNVAEKDTMFKICFAARMDCEEASEFLNYFGYSFSKDGVNEEDDLVKDLLSRHTYNVLEINKAFIKATGHPFFK